MSFIISLTKITVGLVGLLVVYGLIKLFDVNLLGIAMSDVETPFYPALILIYFGIIVGTTFQGTQDITTKTIIQCYLMDSEMFTGDQRYCDERIKNFMDRFGNMQEF